mmetsp:Transcript_1165/g.3053  ORF Transcript_1165/g.3053 Transcript_1165/m.3053 type:complete len:392 (-) Transcript_1165:226-1401(-)
MTSRTPPTSFSMSLALAGARARFHNVARAQSRTSRSALSESMAACMTIERAPSLSPHMCSLFSAVAAKFLSAPKAQTRAFRSAASDKLAASSRASRLPSSSHMDDVSWPMLDDKFCNAPRAQVLATRSLGSGILAAATSAQRATASAHIGPFSSGTEDKFCKAPAAQIRTRRKAVPPTRSPEHMAARVAASCHINSLFAFSDEHTIKMRYALSLRDLSEQFAIIAAASTAPFVPSSAHISARKCVTDAISWRTRKAQRRFRKLQGSSRSAAPTMAKRAPKSCQTFSATTASLTRCHNTKRPHSRTSTSTRSPADAALSTTAREHSASSQIAVRIEGMRAKFCMTNIAQARALSSAGSESNAALKTAILAPSASRHMDSASSLDKFCRPARP